MVRIAAYILTLTLFIGCHKATDEHTYPYELPEATITIQNLRSKYVGSGGVFLGDNIVVRGNVISSDSEDNFYNSLIIDDGTGALELKIGTWNISAVYPEGLEVALTLDRLYADYQYGILQVGYKPESYANYAVEKISANPIIDRIIARGSDIERIVPRMSSVDMLNLDDCGRLYYFEDMRLVESSSIDTLRGETIEDARWRGYAMFRNDKGDSIAVYTNSYAWFAESHIPTTPLSLVGILQWGPYNGQERCYQLKMRYASDCHNN